MISKDTKLSSQATKGFTIVELLIVVVVIAILAAITIVSYNGITSRANASSAQSTAATVQKKVELYASEESRYPIAKSEIIVTGKSYTLDTSTIGNAAPTPSTAATKGTGYVQLSACHTGTLGATTVTGTRITWYDYQKAAASALTTIDAGICTGTITALPN